MRSPRAATPPPRARGRAAAAPQPGGKVLARNALAAVVRCLQDTGKRVVFTNGCFDLLHIGHVRYLQAARALGDALVVGLNADASVRRLKGPGRPITPARERAEVLAALACVDHVTVFGETTPLRLIRAVLPDVLVKGGDWPIALIVGREAVEGRGGAVLSLPLVRGASTTAILKRIRASESTAGGADVRENPAPREKRRRSIRP